MVTLIQLPKQKLLCHAHLPWPPAASMEGLYPHGSPASHLPDLCDCPEHSQAADTDF